MYCECIYTCTCIYVYICICIYMYVYIHVYVCARIYICMYLFIYTCVCVRMYTYIHISGLLENRDMFNRRHRGGAERPANIQENKKVNLTPPSIFNKFELEPY